MEKRGQITLIIIIGIMVLFVFAGTLFAVSQITGKKLSLEKEETSFALEWKPKINFFVESCIEKTAAPVIYLMGKQGGVIYPEKNFLFTEKEDVINYVHLNGNFLLEKGEMEQQLDKALDENFESCINQFSSFQNFSLTFDIGRPSFKSKILSDKILINLEYEVEVKNGESNFKVESFQKDISVKLGKYTEIAKEISVKNSGEKLDFASLSIFEQTVTAYPFDGETIIFSLYDESGYEGSPYVFVFAIHNQGIKHEPELEYIQDFVLAKGFLFAYKLKATDKDGAILVFNSDSSEIPVSSDGQINFIPQKSGTFYTVFTVKDSTGLKDEQKVRFVVE